MYQPDRTVFEYFNETVAERPTLQPLQSLPVDDFADRTSVLLANFPGLCLARVTIKPGQSHPPHYHKEGTQTLHVVQGRGTIRISEQDYELTPGATVIIPRNAPHYSTNTGAEPLSYIQMLTPE